MTVIICFFRLKHLPRLFHPSRARQPQHGRTRRREAGRKKPGVAQPAFRQQRRNLRHKENIKQNISPPGEGTNGPADESTDGIRPLTRWHPASTIPLASIHMLPHEQTYGRLRPDICPLESVHDKRGDEKKGNSYFCSPAIAACVGGG